jgi:aspartate/methionine/tyrosine aminotransferase
VRPVGSDYLRWAKTAPPARFNLTSSGVPYLPAEALPVDEAMELSGTGAYGFAPLQQAIAARYRVPVECCAAAMGCSMANHLAMAALLRPGDRVVIEHPTYEPLIAVARYLGATVVPFQRRADREFRLDPEAVERAAAAGARLIVLTNLHNPSSALAGEAELRAVGELAERIGAHVLVDEVYLDALWRPETAFSLGDRFIATSSLTKVYGLNGLRCGWILAEPGLTERMWRLTELFNNIGAHPAERLSLAAFRALDAIAARARAILEANAATLNAFYRSRDDLKWMEHRAGTVSFPGLPGVDVDAFCARLLAEDETAVVPGSFFGAPDHLRIGLGVAPECFTEGLARLGRALDRSR